VVYGLRNICSYRIFYLVVCSMYLHYVVRTFEPIHKCSSVMDPKPGAIRNAIIVLVFSINY
jgi:hypothetical protein